jgi:crossover junction endodeoxyribonuclease RusA
MARRITEAQFAAMLARSPAAVRPAAHRTPEPSITREPAPCGLSWRIDRPADVSLTLPLPPSANRMWRHGRGRTYPSDEYEAWCKEVMLECVSQRARGRAPRCYAILIVVPRNRKDLDNIVKPTQDGLAFAGVIANDRHAQRIVLDIDHGREKGTMSVGLWAMADPPKPSQRKATSGRGVRNDATRPARRTPGD